MQIQFTVIQEGNKVTLPHQSATHLIHIHTIFFKIHNAMHWTAPSPGRAYSKRSLLGVFAYKVLIKLSQLTECLPSMRKTLGSICSTV